MASYISEAGLRELLVDFIRMTARSVTDVRVELIPGPFRPGNWRIVWIDVLAEDYSAARDVADDLESRRDWIMVPDGHSLAGQVLGKEYDRSWPVDRPEAEPFGAAEYDPGHGSISGLEDRDAETPGATFRPEVIRGLALADRQLGRWWEIRDLVEICNRADVGRRGRRTGNGRDGSREAAADLQGR